MSNQLPSVYSADVVNSVGRIAKVFAQSGYFKDASDLAKAAVKIFAGVEMGIGPMEATTGIHVIQGKPTLSANLMAARVRACGYDYRVKKLTDSECKIEFFSRLNDKGERESLGFGEFSLKDAERAQLLKSDNWKKYPQNMLFARAMSNGCRFHTPDISAGPAYVPEELGAKVDEEGAPIEIEIIEPKKPKAPQPGPTEDAPPVQEEIGFEPGAEMGCFGHRFETGEYAGTSVGQLSRDTILQLGRDKTRLVGMSEADKQAVGDAYIEVVETMRAEGQQNASV